MSTLGRAVIEFAAETAKFTSDVGRAAAAFDKGMARMQAGMGALRNAIVAAAGLGGMGLLVQRTIDLGEQLNKMSQSTGLGVEFLSGLSYQAKLADVETEGLNMALREFNKSMAEALDKNSKTARIFDALGVDIRQGPEPALRQFAEAVSKLDDGFVKTSLSTQIMGRQGDKLIPMLNAGAKGMDKAAESARNLGILIGPDFAKKAEEFNDNMKTLGTMSTALGMSIAEKLVPGLSSLTENLVKANESGQGFLGWLKEIVKLDLALLAKLFRNVPGLGIGLDALAESAFTPAPGRPVTGKIRRPTPEKTPNPKQVACVVAGGKWVNNACVFAADDKSGEIIMRALLEDQEEQARIMSEAAAAADDMNARLRRRERMENIFGEEGAMGRTTEEMEEQVKLWVMPGGIIDSAQDYDILIGQLHGGFDGLGRAIEADTKLAADFGFTFSSAFEDAILNGEKLREVVNALGRDIARMVIRKTITEPLGNFITDALVRSGFNLSFGSVNPFPAPQPVFGDNPEFFPGYANGTDYVPKTGLALVHQGERIIPAGDNNGGMTVHIHANDARSFAEMMSTPAGRAVITTTVERAMNKNGRRSGMAA